MGFYSLSPYLLYKVYMAIIKAELSKDIRDKREKSAHRLALESQKRLAEILNDSPHLVSLNGTEWEVRALRFGTQWLVSKKCVEVAEADTKTFGDVIKQFSVNIPAILDVLTLCLLNDKNKIYKDGNERNGYSKLYYATRDTLEWECNVSQFGNILLECLQLLDVDFFYQSLDMLQIFRESVLGMKRKRIAEQK